MKKIVLGLAIVAAVAGCSRAGSSPAATVEDFAKRLDSGNCTGLRDVFTASSRDLVGPKIESVCELGKTQREKTADGKEKRLKQVHILETKEEGDRATVRAELESTAGDRDGAQTFVLVRENGAWKIDLMATGQLNQGGGMGAGGPGAGAGPAMPPMATPPATVPPAATTPAPTTEAPTEAPAPADADTE